MKHPSHLLDHLSQVTELYRRRPRSLITDIDGTISELAPTPEEAFVSTKIRQLLQELKTEFDVLAAISGRTLNEARGMLGEADLLLVGNHGLEKWNNGEIEYSDQATPWVSTIADVLSSLSGMLNINGLRFENKGVSASIHYRRTADPASARRTILTVLREAGVADRFIIREGKMVVELRPPLAIDKGTALTDLVYEYGLRSVVYLGDDDTDLDAFAAVSRLNVQGACRGFSVAVGEDADQEVLASADFYLRGVSEVETFLSWLALGSGELGSA